MMEISFVVNEIQLVGVLPIMQEDVDHSYAVAPDNQESLLLNFANALQHNSGESDSSDLDALSKLVTGKKHPEGKIKVKPGDETSSMYGSTGEEYTFEWYWETQLFWVDFFGNNEPTYDLQTVVVSGQSIGANWNFPQIDIDFNHFINMVDGGGNGTTTTGDCATQHDAGAQKIKWSVIEGFEGNKLGGYVPLKNGVPFANSGVTVASGFDLGARDLSDLTELDLSAPLIEALKPYLGLKGQAAYDKEVATPLNITAEQATELNTASHSATLASVVAAYDKAVGAGSFYTLPSEAQTVIASVSFQYGNLATKTPSFWTQVTSKDWAGAEANLRSFGDDFTTRRTSEANLLKAAKDAGTLHDGTLC